MAKIKFTKRNIQITIAMLNEEDIKLLTTIYDVCKQRLYEITRQTLLKISRKYKKQLPINYVFSNQVAKDREYKHLTIPLLKKELDLLKDNKEV